MQPDDRLAAIEQAKNTLSKIGHNPLGADTAIQDLLNIIAGYEQQIVDLDKTIALRSAQLIASTSNAYSFLDSLNMGFIMCDVNPEIVVANNSIRNILGTGLNTDPTQITWNLQGVSQLIGELDLKSLVQSSLQTNQSIQKDAINCGTKILQVFIAPLTNEVEKGNFQHIGAVILFEDITEQKMLERSKDEFLSIASHELRTPLTAIRGNSSMIKKYYGAKIQDTDVIEMIDDIHNSSVRLIEIVNDFLDVSALEQGKMQINPEDFALSDVVNDVVRDLENICKEKGVILQSDPTIAATPLIHADKQRIKQVVYNLIGNASKFTDQGSITIRAKNDENYAFISVIDTGRGMSPENQKLLFRKFQQAGSSILTRDTTKGTGLGLYISKLIVELSGGSIGLEYSAEGKGSSFVFSLPIAKSKV